MPVPQERSGAPAQRPALFAGVEPLEVFVDLLADTSTSEFYDRICEAICRLTTMRRAAIFMAESERGAVSAVGAYGIPLADLATLRPTLAQTPIALRALREDAVVVISEEVERAVPADYARVLGITTLVCTPLSAAGRPYGVICADRGGGRFELTDGERHLLWTLGKTAALVTTAQLAAHQQESGRRLADQLALAREIHERVLQRLFGVSLALGAEQPLDPPARERCRSELQLAVTELRRALERPLAVLPRETTSTLAQQLELLRGELPAPVQVRWPASAEVPPELEPLAQSFLNEALRNVGKHARPSRIDVAVERNLDTFTLEVRNDGVRRDRTAPASGRGMGLRLAAFEVLREGGCVEFGPVGADGWRARLVVPCAAGAGA
jgi:signal transduction histidine kinase